jgi:hypothetical protein
VSDPAQSSTEICGRLLIGQGTDTWDPTCQRLAGHTGRCLIAPDLTDADACVECDRYPLPPVPQEPEPEAGADYTPHHLR